MKEKKKELARAKQINSAKQIAAGLAAGSAIGVTAGLLQDKKG